MRWLLTRGTDGIYLIYDTQGHEIGRNERPAGLEAFFPLCSTDGIYLIYDTQGHEIGRNERPAGLEAFFPLCMLDDGRLLMVVGYDWEHDSAARYAVMDADEFLNGGSTYREMTFAE